MSMTPAPMTTSNSKEDTLTAASYRVLRCDAKPFAGKAQPCGSEGSAPYEPPTYRNLRAWLKGHGWRQRPGGRDICPNCWKEGRR